MYTFSPLSPFMSMFTMQLEYTNNIALFLSYRCKPIADVCQNAWQTDQFHFVGRGRSHVWWRCFWRCKPFPKAPKQCDSLSCLRSNRRPNDSRGNLVWMRLLHQVVSPRLSSFGLSNWGGFDGVGINKFQMPDVCGST